MALNGRCFDPHDIPSEEDLADASRTLQALAGTIAGTMTESEVDALTKRRAKAVNNEDVWTPSIVVSAQRDFDEAAMIVAAVNE